MERQIIGVSLLDHKTNTWDRQQTQVVYIRTKKKKKLNIDGLATLKEWQTTGGHQELPLGSLDNSREAEEDQA